MPLQKPCIAAFSEEDSSRAPNKLASSSSNFAPPPQFSSVVRPWTYLNHNWKVPGKDTQTVQTLWHKLFKWMMWPNLPNTKQSAKTLPIFQTLMGCYCRSPIFIVIRNSTSQSLQMWKKEKHIRAQLCTLRLLMYYVYRFQVYTCTQSRHMKCWWYGMMFKQGMIKWYKNKITNADLILYLHESLYSPQVVQTRVVIVTWSL